MSREMPTPPGPTGQDLGDVRSPLPMDRLVPYLEKHVAGFKIPLEVKQFKVGRVDLCGGQMWMFSVLTRC